MDVKEKIELAEHKLCDVVKRNMEDEHKLVSNRKMYLDMITKTTMDIKRQTENMANENAEIKNKQALFARGEQTWLSFYTKCINIYFYHLINIFISNIFISLTI